MDSKGAGGKPDPAIDGEPLGGRTAVRGSGPAPPATFAELRKEHPRRADESATKYRERLYKIIKDSKKAPSARQVIWKGAKAPQK